MQILESSIDNSVNFIEQLHVGNIEARYVRRSDDYFIAYLSSQSGCKQGCAMCHLTATNQRKLVDLTIDQMIDQATTILEYYQKQSPAVKVHYNYMARGEPLANSNLLFNNEVLFDRLANMANQFNLISKQNISTILPNSLDAFPSHKSLSRIFQGPIIPNIYYSLYSLDTNFRNKWLPNAIDGYLGLDMLAEWQQNKCVVPKIHYAFIEGENDSERNIIDICNAIISRGLIVDFNIVRYNPYSSRYGKESHIDVIDNNVKLLSQLLSNSKIKIVSRVGYDVKASCGMFVGNRGNR